MNQLCMFEKEAIANISSRRDAYNVFESMKQLLNQSLDNLQFIYKRMTDDEEVWRPFLGKIFREDDKAIPKKDYQETKEAAMILVFGEEYDTVKPIFNQKPVPKPDTTEWAKRKARTLKKLEKPFEILVKNTKGIDAIKLAMEFWQNYEGERDGGMSIFANQSDFLQFFGICKRSLNKHKERVDGDVQRRFLHAAQETLLKKLNSSLDSELPRSELEDNLLQEVDCKNIWRDIESEPSEEDLFTALSDAQDELKEKFSMPIDVAFDVPGGRLRQFLSTSLGREVHADSTCIVPCEILDLKGKDESGSFPKVLCAGTNALSKDLKEALMDYYHENVAFGQREHKSQEHSFGRLYCEKGNTKMTTGRNKGLNSSPQTDEVEKLVLDLQTAVVDYVITIVNEKLAAHQKAQRVRPQIPNCTHVVAGSCETSSSGSVYSWHDDADEMNTSNVFGKPRFCQHTGYNLPTARTMVVFTFGFGTDSDTNALLQWSNNPSDSDIGELLGECICRDNFFHIQLFSTQINGVKHRGSPGPSSRGNRMIFTARQFLTTNDEDIYDLAVNQAFGSSSDDTTYKIDGYKNVVRGRSPIAANASQGTSQNAKKKTPKPKLDLPKTKKFCMLSKEVYNKLAGKKAKITIGKNDVFVSVFIKPKKTIQTKRLHRYKMLQRPAFIKHLLKNGYLASVSFSKKEVEDHGKKLLPKRKKPAGEKGATVQDDDEDEDAGEKFDVPFLTEIDGKLLIAGDTFSGGELPNIDKSRKHETVTRQLLDIIVMLCATQAYKNHPALFKRSMNLIKQWRKPFDEGGGKDPSALGDNIYDLETIEVDLSKIPHDCLNGELCMSAFGGSMTAAGANHTKARDMNAEDPAFLADFPQTIHSKDAMALFDLQQHETVIPIFQNTETWGVDGVDNEEDVDEDDEAEAEEDTQMGNDQSINESGDHAITDASQAYLSHSTSFTGVPQLGMVFLRNFAKKWCKGKVISERFTTKQKQTLTGNEIQEFCWLVTYENDEYPVEQMTLAKFQDETMIPPEEYLLHEAQAQAQEQGFEGCVATVQDGSAGASQSGKPPLKKKTKKAEGTRYFCHGYFALERLTTDKLTRKQIEDRFAAYPDYKMSFGQFLSFLASSHTTAKFVPVFAGSDYKVFAANNLGQRKEPFQRIRIPSNDVRPFESPELLVVGCLTTEVETAEVEPAEVEPRMVEAPQQSLEVPKKTWNCRPYANEILDLWTNNDSWKDYCGGIDRKAVCDLLDKSAMKNFRVKKSQDLFALLQQVMLSNCIRYLEIGGVFTTDDDQHKYAVPIVPSKEVLTLFLINSLKRTPIPSICRSTDVGLHYFRCQLVTAHGGRSPNEILSDLQQHTEGGSNDIYKRVYPGMEEEVKWKADGPPVVDSKIDEGKLDVTRLLDIGHYSKLDEANKGLVIECLFQAILFRCSGRIEFFEQYAHHMKEQYPKDDLSSHIPKMKEFHYFAKYILNRSEKTMMKAISDQHPQHVLSDLRQNPFKFVQFFTMMVDEGMKDLKKSFDEAPDDPDTSRKYFVEKVAMKIAQGVLGWNKLDLTSSKIHPDTLRVLFDAHMALADLEELFKLVFGSVTEDSVHLGHGAREGQQLWWDGSTDFKSVWTIQHIFEDCLSYLHKKSWCFLLALGMKRCKIGGRVFYIWLNNGREFCLTDVEHFLCKIIKLACYIHSSRVFSDRPTPQKHYTWFIEMEDTVADRNWALLLWGFWKRIKDAQTKLWTKGEKDVKDNQISHDCFPIPPQKYLFDQEKKFWEKSQKFWLAEYTGEDLISSALLDDVDTCTPRRKRKDQSQQKVSQKKQHLSTAKRGLPTRKAAQERKRQASLQADLERRAREDHYRALNSDEEEHDFALGEGFEEEREFESDDEEESESGSGFFASKEESESESGSKAGSKSGSSCDSEAESKEESDDEPKEKCDSKPVEETGKEPVDGSDTESEEE